MEKGRLVQNYQVPVCQRTIKTPRIEELQGRTIQVLFQINVVWLNQSHIVFLCKRNCGLICPEIIAFIQDLIKLHNGSCKNDFYVLALHVYIVHIYKLYKHNP